MSRLLRQAEAYLAMRRGLGYRLEQDGKRLLEFASHLDQSKLEFVTIESALAWAQRSATPHTAARRLAIVRGFASFLAVEDLRTEVPPANLLPDRTQRQIPYIYSDAEVRTLLAAARGLSGKLRPETYATLFGLLAATGMRVGEATALDRGHFDPGTGMLTVWKGKQDRSRLLPLHPTTRDAIQSYVRARDRTFRRPGSPSFFLSEAGTRLLRQNVHETFLRLVERAGLSDRKPRRPRIHDLRHTFAVRLLSEWHRRGIDAEKMLPRLSTYLGHVSPTSTYWYLTATPALLTRAAKRRERAKGRTS